jgi:hypothetical protein
VPLYLERVNADRDRVDTTPKNQSLLVGAVLVEAGLLEVDQLQRALAVQAETGERFGEIVVAEFGVSRLELASVLAEQRATYEVPDPPTAREDGASAGTLRHEPSDADEPARRIGAIFLEHGSIDQHELDSALEVQRQTGGRLGEILISQGTLTRIDLASALTEQWAALPRLRPPQPGADPSQRQTSAATPAPTTPAWMEDLRHVVAALDERLATVETSTADTTWEHDLQIVATDLRAAIAAVEAQLASQPTESSWRELGETLHAIGSRVEAL